VFLSDHSAPSASNARPKDSASGKTSRLKRVQGLLKLIDVYLKQYGIRTSTDFVKLKFFNALSTLSCN